MTLPESRRKAATDAVSIEGDHTTRSLPRHRSARESGAAPRQPALWTSPPTVEVEGVWGAFPKGFIAWAAPQLGCHPADLLHLCSGSLPAGTGRARVDVRREANPDVVADARRLPFPDATFAGVLLDPPYAIEYARDLYGIEYPRPSHLLAEAARVVKPCGRIGFVHFIIPMPPPRCRLVAVRGITTGCGYRIRAMTIFVREQDDLFWGEG